MGIIQTADFLKAAFALSISDDPQLTWSAIFIPPDGLEQVKVWILWLPQELSAIQVE